MSLPNLDPTQLDISPADMRETPLFQRDTLSQNHAYSTLAAKLKAAGHPIRLQIITLLDGEEVSVGGLMNQV